jgi:hypothetical protein
VNTEGNRAINISDLATDYLVDKKEGMRHLAETLLNNAAGGAAADPSPAVRTQQKRRETP